ncbi:phenylalanine--tRNA ligase subunit beta [Candidatus Woesearchaeota archaeon]|nr:phenylalanine--tRNA ligase subunit beta [Candidatus Woesearchaeota archaeon]
MPTISFSLKDLQQLVDKKQRVKITPESLVELAHYCKGELEGYDKRADEVSIELDDTNLPYLWSVEGIARLFRGVFGLQRGVQEIKVEKGNYDVIVDRSVSGVRPYIAGFVASGGRLDDYLLKQLIQLQDKLDTGYGRRRQKVSIGLYSSRKIRFPVHYRTSVPAETSFVPLGMDKKLNLSQILVQHPKGRDYAWILKGFSQYPVLSDDRGEVLSFPPIINSNFIGKLEVGDSDIFFEVTGTDEAAILLVANIFAYALSERGFTIHSANIIHPKRKLSTPLLSPEKVKIRKEDVRALLGLELSDSQVKDLLERAGYGFSNYTVTIPPYRADIMHPFDVLEDVAIMYGFGNIEPQELESYTVGQKLPIVGFADKFRELVIGLGYQEVMSQILSSKAALYEKMGIKDFGTVEIEQFMSESFSVVRTWIVPVLLDVLSGNKHVDFPQRVFEQGLVTVRKGDIIQDYEKLAVVSSHSAADYTEIRQVVEYLMRQFGIKFAIREAEHSSFIPGRVAALVVGRKEIGFFGEISPSVLSNWCLEMPVVAAEINLSELFGIVSRK